jgi:phosphotransferase family enzyme
VLGREGDWLDPVLSWIREQIDAEKASITEFTILRGSSVPGCLIRVHTTSGLLYFKSVMTFLSHEPKLTSTLSKLYKNQIPEVVGVDYERHWLLTRDVGGHSLENTSNIQRWEEALRIFSQMQLSCADYLDHLSMSGCLNWRLDRLETEIDGFFDFAYSLGTEKAENLIHQKGGTVSALAAYLKESCIQLNSYDIPQSLVHGDFNLDNIYVTNERCVFLDWAEGYVGYPFFVLVDFLAHISHNRPELNDFHASFHTAYLEPWTKYMSTARLKEAFQLSRPLAVLRYALRVIESELSIGEITLEDKERLATFLNSLILHMHRYAFPHVNV